MPPPTLRPSPPRNAKPVAAAAARVAAIALALAAATAAAQPAAARAEADAAFREGLAALHSFEYEDANAAFLRAQQADPAFALAYWGEAMTWHQSLWGAEDMAAGRRALDRLPADAAARAAAAEPRTARLLAAARMLFGEGDAASRRQRYAAAMAAAHQALPADADVGALYGLALLGTMSRSLIGGSESHEGHSANLAGSEVQTRVAALLRDVLAREPQHPGALHYLIHAYDDPEHAPLALDAARAYAATAPASSHARHMPAHIFLQLGRWTDAEASDRDAYATSVAWAARRGHPPAMRNFHALAWRQYELLQLGRLAEAASLLEEIAPVVASTGDLRLLSDLASMRARQAVESRHWDRLGRERNFANVNELCAIGFSAARTGNAPLAELARQTLAVRAAAPEEGALRPAIAIMERQVAAVIALAAGRGAEAVEILREATRAELALPAPLGLPIPIIPAPELLGETLLETGQPAEARQAFAQALQRTPNRTRSVLGLARAAAQLGEHDAARTHYHQVLENYAGADAGVPEVAEARAALAGATTAETRVRPLVVPAAITVAVALGGIWLARRRRARPAPVPVNAPLAPTRATRRKSRRK